MNLLGWLSNLTGSEVPRGPAPPDLSIFDAGLLDCSGFLAATEWDEHGHRRDPAAIVAYAVALVGQGRYGLGKGARRQRHRPGEIDGDWISTTSVYRDATGPQRLWRAVPVDEAQAGDGVTYPSTYRLGVRTRIGHCGRIVAVNGPGWAGLDVVDCAGRRPPAIAHRPDGGALWGRRGGVVVRRVG